MKPIDDDPDVPLKAKDPFKKVMRLELVRIRERRKKAFGDGVPETAGDDLVGLTCSGGGIRSASFNLGVLQALHETDVLRSVDYLSTVSGGGYIGSWLSQQARAMGEKNQPFHDKSGEHPLSHGPGGRLSKPVRTLLYRGKSLLDPLRFFDRYALGLLLVNLWAFSLILSACALAAFLWRLLDLDWVRHWLSLWGLGYDVATAFLPSLMIFFAWILAWSLGRRSWGLRKLKRVLLGFLAISLLLGIAVLLGNGDVSLSPHPRFVEELSVPVPPSLRMPLVLLVLAGLVPLLQLRKVVKSGEQPANLFQTWVFRFTLFAAFVGVPFLITGWLARENVSGYVDFPGQDNGRGPELLRHDVRDWEALCHWILHEGDSPNLWTECWDHPAADAAQIAALPGPGPEGIASKRLGLEKRSHGPQEVREGGPGRRRPARSPGAREGHQRPEELCPQYRSKVIEKDYAFT